MQRFSGALMIVAGAALGGYMILPAPQIGGDTGSTSRISDASSVAAPIVTAAVAAPAAVTTGAAAVVSAPAVSADGKRTFSTAAPLSPEPQQAAAAAASSTWTAVVTSDPATAGKMKSSRPGDPSSRAALASDIQRELTRVGCYGGEINGAWTPSSKKAMSAFMERVNATLPIEEPDYILLTLVQGHAASACGAECPSGEVQSAAGRCVPQAVVAQSVRKAQRDDERRAAQDRQAHQQELLAQEQKAAAAKRLADTRKSAEAARLAAAEAALAKIADARKAAQDKVAQDRVAEDKIAEVKPKPAKPQQTAAVEPEKLPWLSQDKSATQTATAAVPLAPRGAPLPGMMSVGGPRNAGPEVPAAVAAVTPDRGPAPIDTAATQATEQPAVPQGSLEKNQDKIIAPAPRLVIRPAVRPAQSKPAVSRSAAVSGLPGSKSGPAVTGLPGTKSGPAVTGLPGSKSGPAIRRSVSKAASAKPKKYRTVKYRPATIVRRPPPVVVYVKPKYKSYAYASNSGGGKARRGQPRAGTARYNLMMSLGGIY
jgi:hypothetical protein